MGDLRWVGCRSKKGVLMMDIWTHGIAGSATDKGSKHEGDRT
jgi:hypothetical protein